MFINVTATIIILSTKLSHLSLSCYPRFHGYNICLWRTTSTSIKHEAPQRQCGSIQWVISTILVCVVYTRKVLIQLKFGKRKHSSSKYTWTAYFVLHCSNLFFFKVDGFQFVLSSSTSQHSVTSSWSSLMSEWCSFGVWAVWEVYERTSWAESVYVIQDKSRWTLMECCTSSGPLEKYFIVQFYSRVRGQGQLQRCQHWGTRDLTCFWL